MVTVTVNSTMTALNLTDLVGDNDYTVTVDASTGAGRGSSISASVRLPAGPCTSHAHITHVQANCVSYCHTFSIIIVIYTKKNDELHVATI